MEDSGMAKNPTPRQIAEIVTMLANGEYDREFAQAIIGHRVQIIDQPREQTGSPYRGGPLSDLPPHHYRITVTSTATPTYAELCKAYDWVSELWDESKFTLELHVSLRKLTPSTGDKIIFLQKFDRDTTSEDAIAWGQTRGYRLAFPAEREAFTKANPDLQKKFWIVDLGSFALHGDHRLVPVLNEDDGERDLGHYWFDDGWDAVNCFLFVRE
jgi:hypothetical protein